MTCNCEKKLPFIAPELLDASRKHHVDCPEAKRTEPVKKFLLPEQRTYLRAALEARRREQLTVEAALAVALDMIDEVDNCVCWGVNCVHQAKALDESYSEHQKRAFLVNGIRQILADENLTVDRIRHELRQLIKPQGEPKVGTE